MNSYIFPCPNGGACRRQHLAKSDIHIDGDRHGIMTAVKTTEHNIPSTHFYKCCTMCKLPIDTYEAVKLNMFLGNPVDKTPIDDDFLRILNEQ